MDKVNINHILIKLVVSALVGNFSIIGNATASQESKWYYMWCTMCDKESNTYYVSTPVLARSYDFKCLGGAFYNKIGTKGNQSNGYKTKEEALKHISKWKKGAKKVYGSGDVPKIKTVNLPRYCKA